MPTDYSSAAAVPGKYAPGSGNYTLTINQAFRTISAPSGNATGANAVTLNAVTPSDGGCDGTVEYGYNTSNSAPENGWQSDTTYTGLDADTTYYFFARVTGGTNYEDATSSGTAITTSPTPTYCVINSAIEADGTALVIPPMEFKITVTYNN